MKKIYTFIFIIILLFTTVVFCQPQLPSDFWGTVKINGEDAPVGTVLIPTINNIPYPMNDTLIVQGQYGLLSINSDYISTPDVKEGGSNGDEIVFKAKIGALEYTLTPTGVWLTSITQRLDLVNEGAIPVELSSFYLTLDSSMVTLHWITQSERNNFGFEVQRSPDATNFHKIGFVNGHGTTSEPHRYKFVDQTSTRTNSFYRLKQIDTDGSFTLTQTVAINSLLPNNYRLDQNYPNPFNPVTHIPYFLMVPGEIKIDIFDIRGQFIQNLAAGYQTSGKHLVTWDGKNSSGAKAANGVYIYRLTADRFDISKKLILMK